MKEILLKISKILFGIIFAIVFGFVLLELLVGNMGNIHAKIISYLGFGEEEVITEMKTLRVVYPDEPINLEPTLFTPTARQRLENIYEALVKTDRDLKIKPSLAVSWGLIDDFTWEFRLRPNVKFHNGSLLEAIDVKMSLERAEKFTGSEVASMVENIKSVEIIDDLTLRIITNEPDPLLLQKMSMILIVPSEYWSEEMEIPVGTGSYEFESWDYDKEMVIKRFEDYWGKRSLFEKVELYTSVDKFERVNLLIDRVVDMTSFVPYDGIEAVKESGFNLVTVPSLEVQFLVFNMNSPLMKDMENRKLISLVINQEDLIQAVGGYAREVNQFVSGGVVGFNPKISKHVYDLDQARKLGVELGFIEKTVQLHLVKGLTILGDYVKNQLSEIGVDVVVSYLDGEELFKSMQEGKADIYFLGFKSEMGDSSSFLYSIVRSGESYNYWGYKNEYVDKLIDGLMIEMDVERRLKDMQEVMEVVVEDDILGVPLFEYENVYAFNDKVEVRPRIDGIIRFDELTVK